MRTSVTLDDDVAAKLEAETQQSGRSFEDTVNDTLRRGLAARSSAPPRAPFKVIARDLGQLRPGVSLDNITDLLEQIEGPQHR